MTYWLQAVAIAIGLFGVAASFSAQVLSRRKEFGLLAHLGLTRGQVLRVVAAEGLAWTTLGALAGLGIGQVAQCLLQRGHIRIRHQPQRQVVDARVPAQALEIGQLHGDGAKLAGIVAPHACYEKRSWLCNVGEG